MHWKKYLACFVLILNHSAFANLPFFPIQFPRDEAAHQSNVPYDVTNMSEWWYYNGKLTTTDNRHFAYYLSFNRFQVDFAGKLIVVPRLEIQLTDIDNKIVYGNALMLTDNQTAFSTDHLSVSFGKDNTLEKDQNTYLVNALVTSKKGEKIKLALRLTPARDVLLIDNEGLADMWSNTNTYYYSLTHLITTGSLAIDNNKWEVDEKKSLSWMDHQWGDFLIIPGLNQWTWSSIQLENGLEINLSTVFDPSHPGAKKILRTDANIVMPDSSHRQTRNLTITAEADPTHKHPLKYHVSIPDIQLKLDLNSLVPDQDVNGISEGVSEAIGTFQGNTVKGFAFAESTVE